MPQTIWHEDVFVKSYDVDFKNRLKINQLFNYMQEAAGNHAEHLGWGYRDIVKNNLIWVLSRVKVRMDEYPPWGSIVKVETWPKDTYRLFATRDFIFKNESGRQLGVATTVWLLLDINTMRPQRVQNVQELYLENRDRHGLNETLEKLSCEGDLLKTFERTVSYNDIDINCHVNNARYVDWLLECFPAETLSDRQISSLQLNYLSEAKSNEIILISMYTDINKTFYFIEGINKESGSVIFQSRLELV
jgi:medium-chain acyl-[acyl-carrier-protein] hydrolase